MAKDKIQHFAACYALALVNYLVLLVLGGSIAVNSTAAMSTASSAALAKEYGDSKAIGNKWDHMDILADELGALFGTLTGLIVQLIIQ